MTSGSTLPRGWSGEADPAAQQPGGGRPPAARVAVRERLVDGTAQSRDPEGHLGRGGLRGARRGAFSSSSRSRRTPLSGRSTGPATATRCARCVLRIAPEGGAFQSSVFESNQPPDTVDLAEHRPALRKWLRSLPRPVAVFVWNSEIGREIVACGEQVQRRIPDDLAVLVAEYDQLLTALAPVPLSNIDQAPGRVEREAAALLDRMMRGEPAPESPITVPPVGVVQRRSTQTNAIDDPFLSQILGWMRANAHRLIQIADIEERFGVSRRKLEHRFQQVLESTPAHEARGGSGCRT